MHIASTRGHLLEMKNVGNYILQLTDTVTQRFCSIRIEHQDLCKTLGELIDQYVKHPPITELIKRNQITDQSATSLLDIQDYVFSCSDNGRLIKLYDGILFKQFGKIIRLGQIPVKQPVTINTKQTFLIQIIIDRVNVDYDRNWIGFHKRRWIRNEHVLNAFVIDAIEEIYSSTEIRNILNLHTKKSKIKFLKAVAQSIWNSPFENYSRYVGRKLRYKTGDETIINIREGRGGICSEKVQALKFITDQYGLQSEYLIAGANAKPPVPESRLRQILDSFDFSFSKRYMRYWQHAALLYDIEGTKFLVDVTNGNIPLVICDNIVDYISNDQLNYRLKVRMSVKEEEFYYHRITQDIPENLYFAMEGWVEDVDLIQVFDNELGLYISSDLFIGPLIYKNEAGYEKLASEYRKVSCEAGLECYITPTWTLDSGMGAVFKQKEPDAYNDIISAKTCLLDRYDDCHGRGHNAGLVIIELNRTRNGP